MGCPVMLSIEIKYKQQSDKKENIQKACSYVKSYKPPDLFLFFFLQDAEYFSEKLHRSLFLMPTANVRVYLSAIKIDSVVVSLSDNLYSQDDALRLLKGE